MALRVLLINDFRRAGGAESVYNATYDVLAEDDRFRVARFDKHSVPSGSSIRNNKAWNLAAGAALRKTLEEFEPEVVWVHNFHGFLSSAIFPVLGKAKRESRFIVAMTLHDYQLVGFNPTLLAYRGREPIGSTLVERLGHWSSWIQKATPKPRGIDLARKIYWTGVRKFAGWSDVIDTVLCPSPFMYSVAETRGLPHPFLLRQPSFASPSELDEKPSREETKGIRLLYIGRLSPEKGVFRFLSLLAAAGFPHVDRVDIVGGGDDLEPIRAWVAENHYDSRFVIHGPLDREAALAELARSDAIVVPSLWYENAPMVIIEAASFGKPALTRQFGSLKTFAGDVGNTVAWHDDDSPAALGDAMARLAVASAGDHVYDTSDYSTAAYIEAVYQHFRDFRATPRG